MPLTRTVRPPAKPPPLRMSASPSTSSLISPTDSSRTWTPGGSRPLRRNAAVSQAAENSGDSGTASKSGSGVVVMMGICDIPTVASRSLAPAPKPTASPARPPIPRAVEPTSAPSEAAGAAASP